MLIVFLSPQLGVHLQLHVLEIHLPARLLHVALGHVVGRISPVRMGGKFGQFLPTTQYTYIYVVLNYS